MDEPILRARALVLADLDACGRADATAVSIVDEACSTRRWWVEQWSEGTTYVAGLIAQDVQDTLADSFDRNHPDSRWPICSHCDPDTPVHVLRITPDLGGPEPRWVCEESDRDVAPLGGLGT